jgi:hypothetical protein
MPKSNPDLTCNSLPQSLENQIATSSQASALCIITDLPNAKANKEIRGDYTREVQICLFS